MFAWGDGADDMTPRELFEAVTQLGKPDGPLSYEWTGIDDETLLRCIEADIQLEEIVAQSEYFVCDELSSVSCLLIR
jgi:hypothetical protein